MLLTVYLLFIGLHVSEGCTLENREQLLPITAHTGGSVLLPCSCTDIQTKPEGFIWKRPNSTANTWKEISRESDQYGNRVQLVNDHPPGNLSLLISHLTDKDGGDYQCTVKGSHITIRLTVEEGPHKPKPPTNASTKPTTATSTRPTEKANELIPKTSTFTPVVNSNTDQTNSTTSSSPKPTDTAHSIHFFILIPVLLLLLGLGGVLYWRYRGRGRGKMESQEQRRLKKEEQKTQDEVVHSSTPATDEVTYSTVVHSSRPGTTPTVTDIGDKSEYATIQLNK